MLSCCFVAQISLFFGTETLAATLTVSNYSLEEVRDVVTLFGDQGLYSAPLGAVCLYSIALWYRNVGRDIDSFRILLAVRRGCCDISSPLAIVIGILWRCLMIKMHGVV